MEFITLSDGTGPPRLAQTRPPRGLLMRYWDQRTGGLDVDGDALLADLVAYAW